LATEPPPQRAWRAACPNCGAPVDFRSSASAFAVCSFCKSTVVREGDALRRIGDSAELFDDHTPLQLGAAGKAAGLAFALVGRLQYRHAQGTWNEWHALFDSGRSGWLSEDNGGYVLAFDAPLEGSVPAAASLRPEASLTVNGQGWSVASVAVAKLIAAQGELPDTPNLDRGFVVADLRNNRGEVGTLDYSRPEQPRWSVGKAVALAELAMTGLSEAAAEKALKGRGIACPSCGAALEVKLSTTQSIACHQCHAVVDLSQGVGGELGHYAQGNGSEPQIPLGSMGTLALGGKVALPWQVVGYVERCEVAQSDDDEQVFWREYLLYHRSKGFAFLVDAEDGWSWAAPITGVPQAVGDSVKLDGTLYRKLYDYTGKVTYVLGEFYWPLQRDQTTVNTDYQGSGAAKDKRLNREQSGDEIVWSAGATLSSDAVVQAFRLAPEQRAALKRDALPVSDNAASLLAKVFVWGFVIAAMLLVFRCGGDDECDTLRSKFGQASQEYQNCLASQRSGGYRSSGGSFGGYSSGGSHK
jgi:endogenous inhibitor of DNA gyrase (YacG/DUF329 family)